MGTDRMHSVTDSWGHVWDCERLTIVDGSTVPTSLGVNPQLTIMALALRFGRHLADEIPRRTA
jgi:choline dehydrogenase-like flavoprotein